MNMLDEGLNIVRDRGIAFGDRFLGYFLMSYGCHITNIMNRQNAFFTFQNKIPDLRCQILFTAPPRFSKSLFIKQAIDKQYGLLNCNILQTDQGESAMRYAGYCTEARWTGSTKQEEGETVRDMGIAEKFKTGIIGMEEFAAITAAMKQSHSSHMEQSFALSLFDGDVYKDLKGHTLDYHTDVTLFAGNQVMRFNLGGGIFSRFLHLFWIPSMKEVRTIAELIWEGDNLPSDTVRLANYRKELVVQHENLKKVRHMRFADDVKQYLIEMPHYEQLLYKNLIVGYTVMKDSNIPKKLDIHMDSRIRKYIDRAREWRRQLISDPLGYQIIGSVMDLGGLERFVPIEEVVDVNLIYSTPRALTVKVVNNMMNDFRLKYSGEKNAVKIDPRKVSDYLAKKTIGTS